MKINAQHTRRRPVTESKTSPILPKSTCSSRARLAVSHPHRRPPGGAAHTEHLEGVTVQRPLGDDHPWRANSSWP